MKLRAPLFAFSVVIVLLVRTDAAAQTVFESGVGVALPNLVTISSSQNPDFTDPSISFNGVGYVGLRAGTISDPNLFTESFNMEVAGGASHTRTALQVDITSLLSGFIIHSAELSFLLGSQSGTQTVSASVISFETNGSLGYDWAPTAIGSPVVQSVTGSNDPLIFNSIDVTSLLQARIDQGQDWLGLHLSATGAGNQFVATTTVGQPDRAEVRLTVNFSQIPEPSSLVLLGMMVGGIGLVRRRRQSI